MCLFSGGPKAAPAATSPPPAPAPVRTPDQTSPVSAPTARRKANPQAESGLAVFRNDLLLPGATKGLNL
jgi:hypothetical protein